MTPIVYCADIGSVPNGRFGWARVDPLRASLEIHRGGTEIEDLVEAVSEDVAAARPVAVGFECPLFVPVPEASARLGMARQGDGNRPWSAGAGSGALATGVVEVAWILQELRHRTDTVAFLDWQEFVSAGEGVFLWEAFVTGQAKAKTHADDAAVAVAAFAETLPDPPSANAVTAERPFSLLGAGLLWSGWTSDVSVMRSSCLVIKANPPPLAESPSSSVVASLSAPDPASAPRAHRDPREVERKRTLLEQPHVAPLTDFVRRLRALHGPDSVPWFDPTDAGVEAPILLLFENPGRRADVSQGSGFISADNDDRSAENTWRIFKEVRIDRRREIIASNIVPWYLGDQRAIGSVRVADLDEARPALLELLSLLPRLRVVVLFGRKAQTGWDRAQPQCSAAVLRAPHTSGRWLNAHPEDRTKIVETLQAARRIARAAG